MRISFNTATLVSESSVSLMNYEKSWSVFKFSNRFWFQYLRVKNDLSVSVWYLKRKANLFSKNVIWSGKQLKRIGIFSNCHKIKDKKVVFEECIIGLSLFLFFFSKTVSFFNGFVNSFHTLSIKMLSKKFIEIIDFRKKKSVWFLVKNDIRLGYP